MTAVTTASLADKLREAIDFLEAHPDLPEPYYTISHRLSWGFHNSDEAAADMAAIVRAIGGKWDKNIDEEYYRLDSRVGGLDLEVWAFRKQVCERVSTGTVEVTVDVPTAFESVTKTVETFEWQCKPILAEATS